MRLAFLFRSILPSELAKRTNRLSGRRKGCVILRPEAVTEKELKNGNQKALDITLVFYMLDILVLTGFERFRF